jgi:hypothetical protein
MPKAATSNPPMTETIDRANAAASTLFLGQNGEWWDFWLIVSLIAVALAAIAAGVTTAGSIVSHKREAAASESAIERYKLDTSKEISEANARMKEAELALARLREPRMVDLEKFAEVIAGVPSAEVEVMYGDCADCFWLAAWICDGLTKADWPNKLRPMISEPNAKSPIASRYRGQPWNVTVVASQSSGDGEEPRFMKLTSALVQSLHGERVWGGVDPQMGKDALRIVVAPRA